MEKSRPYVMSFAGLDPSGGAGLLADIKTFEQHRVSGLGVCTAITVQTPDEFISVEWLPVTHILSQASPLLTTCHVAFCKIGIIEDVQVLRELISYVKQLVPGIRIILDPVLSASTGFPFHKSIQQHSWKGLLSDIYLLTPNYKEALLLTGETDGETAATQLSASCAVLLKGGHHLNKPGYDTLYTGSTVHTIAPTYSNVFPKHGSGCVLSASITACLAMGQSLYDACCNGKAYTEKMLASHFSLTGYHYL